MKRQILYLGAILTAIYLVAVGHALWQSGGLRISAQSDSRPPYVFVDQLGRAHALPSAWVGSPHVAWMLGVNLDSRLRFESGAEGHRVSHRLGEESRRAEEPARVPVESTWSGGTTRITWTRMDSEFVFSVADGQSIGSLYVSRNRVRYLVPMSEERSAGSAAAGTGGWRSVLIDTAREGAVLLLPRIVALVVLYVAVAGGFYLVVWRWLKDRLAHRKVQDEWPKKGRLLVEFGHSLIVICTMALVSFCTVFVIESGHSRVYKDVAEYGWAYWFGSLAFIFLLMDAFTYWTHRWMHHPKLFMYFHAIHHRSYQPSPWTTLSMSVNEILLNAVFMPIVILIMPVHQHIAIAFTLMTLFKNVFNHLGFEVFPEWINRWLVGATFHETHHMRFNGNFSSYFTFWDTWMKTESRSYAANVERLRSRAPVPAQGTIRT